MGNIHVLPLIFPYGLFISEFRKKNKKKTKRWKEFPAHREGNKPYKYMYIKII